MYRIKLLPLPSDRKQYAMKDDTRLKRKVRNSYIISTVSMTLVLFCWDR